MILKIFFSLNAIYNLITSILAMNISFNKIEIIYDMIIVFLFITEKIIEKLYIETFKEYFKINLNLDIDKTSIFENDEMKFFTDDYFDFIITAHNITLIVSMIMVVFKNLRLINSVPEIIFFPKLLESVVIAAFHFFLIIFMVILSISIIIHLILGPEVFIISDISTTIMLIINFSINDFSTKNTNSISFLFFYSIILIEKIILMSFLFGIMKGSYTSLINDLQNFKLKPQNKVVGETTITKFTYFLVPFNFYFIYKDWNELYQIYSSLNKEKFVEEGEGNFNQLKIVYNKRIIHIIYTK